MGNVMNAFRLAVVGECKGPHMFDVIEIIGKEETIRRMEKHCPLYKTKSWNRKTIMPCLFIFPIGRKYRRRFGMDIAFSIVAD